MPIKIQRDYLTFEELADRWKLKAGCKDIHCAVLQGGIKPCIMIRQGLTYATLGADGVPVPAVGGTAVTAPEWLYPQMGKQTGVFEAEYTIVSDSPSADASSSFWVIDAPITLSHLIANGVMMMTDIHDAEQTLAESVSSEIPTKERNSMLKLISALLADAYRFDPRRRNETAKTVAEQANMHGIELSDGTVLKFARLAFNEFPPSYMSIPLPQDQAAKERA